jgi:hypothetical protein
MTNPYFNGARASDPWTSHNASERADKGKIAERVIASLINEGPASSRTLARRLCADLVSVSPVLRPLERSQHIVEVGTERGEKGMPVIVWGVR